MDELLATGTPIGRDLEIEIAMPTGVECDLDLQAVEPRQAGALNGHLWEQLVLPRSLPRADWSVFAIAARSPSAGRSLCIHDVNTRICPQSYSMLFRLQARIQGPVLGRTVRVMTSVSEYSATELTRYSGRKAGHVEVVPNGHEHALRWVPEHSRRTAAVAGRRTILLLGSSIPHKNVGIIVGLHERLAAAGLRLAIVGGVDSRVFAAGSAVAASNVEWLGRVSDAELAALLRDCLCLAFPSLVEGFGLPIVEAMAMGCPVVSSDRASMPEVGGDSVLYASPLDPEQWLACFTRLRDSSRLRQEMVARGRRRAQMYSWKASARRYLELMATVDGRAIGARPPDSPVDECVEEKHLGNAVADRATILSIPR